MFAKEHFTFLVPGTRIPTTSSLLSTCWRKSDFSFGSGIVVPPMAVEQKPMRQQEIRPYPHTWQSRGHGWHSKPRDPSWTSLWNRGSAILWAGARLSCFKERPKTLSEINATWPSVTVVMHSNTARSPLHTLTPNQVMNNHFGHLGHSWSNFAALFPWGWPLNLQMCPAWTPWENHRWIKFVINLS